MVTRKPITFKNRDGLTLFGVMEQPAEPRGDMAVILLSPGVKMRVGPHGLYRRMSKMLTDMGFCVFRFDFFGLGDSEGDLEETLLADVYNHIEVGRYVNDAIDAMDWMETIHGYKRFVLGGLCGGAVTGLLAGERDGRVAGLLSLGITPVLASSAADPSRYVTVGELKRLRQGYVRRLLEPKSWLRLLTFQSDYRMIFKSLGTMLKSKSAMPKSTDKPKEEEKSEPDNTNPLFPPAFFRLAERGAPHLLIFSGSDRLYWEFSEKFEPRFESRLKSISNLYDIHVVENANHVLSFREWEQEMLDASRAWFSRFFDLKDFVPSETA